MAVQIARRLFTIDEYEHMISAGVFPPEDRSELIRGEIVEMAPIGLRHAACVGRMTKLLERKFGDEAIVWVQNPIRLVGNSMPQPDLALLKPRPDFYENSLPMPGDVLLVVEVSDSTLEYDIGVKVPLYAEAGIREVWIVNLQDNLIDAFSDPLSNSYSTVERFMRGQSLTLSSKPTISIAVDGILG